MWWSQLSKIVGIKKLEYRLKKLGDKKKYQEALKVSAEELLKNSSAKAEFRRFPVKNPKAPLTGELKRSLKLQLSSDRTEAHVGATKEYAPYVEFGTRKMRAQPFLGPAFKEIIPKFEKRVQNAIKK